MKAAIKARVTGRVQGVAFRAWTRDRAKALGLSGWVRNEADGSVSGYFSGEARAIETMVAALHEGPRFARVQSVETEPAAPDGAADEFVIAG